MTEEVKTSIEDVNGSSSENKQEPSMNSKKRRSKTEGLPDLLAACITGSSHGSLSTQSVLSSAATSTSFSSSIDTSHKACDEHVVPLSYSTASLENSPIVGLRQLKKSPLSGSGLLNFQKSKQETYFKLMVVGKSGLGKSTFINTLFQRSVIDRSRQMEKSKGIIKDSTMRIISHPTVDFQNETNDHVVKLTAVDTPGWGDVARFESDCNLILNYIEKSLHSHDYALPDQRIDCCFYFIQAHRLTELDLCFMKRLQHQVTVIPVLSKYDSMTEAERGEFKEKISFKLKEHDIKTLHINGKRMIYGVIGQENAEEGNISRKYPWGEAEVWSPDHSDMSLLFKDLVEDHFQDLKSETTKKYNSFRRGKGFTSPLKIFFKSHSTFFSILGIIIFLSLLALGVSLIINGLAGREAMFDSCLTKLEILNEEKQVLINQTTRFHSLSSEFGEIVAGAKLEAEKIHSQAQIDKELSQTILKDAKNKATQMIEEAKNKATQMIEEALQISQKAQKQQESINLKQEETFEERTIPPFFHSIFSPEKFSDFKNKLEPLTPYFSISSLITGGVCIIIGFLFRTCSFPSSYKKNLKLKDTN